MLVETATMDAKTDLRAWWRRRPWMMFRVWVAAAVTVVAMVDGCLGFD
ncbi:uncharacterized protein G2W53_018277 [Senna tora]|uniref:Uncharacterized protein n=1 Tax=Senna tora TaxID=362788 RepID=A0A834TRB8_9FABA|nr:uncharacterized protein G2W53_018277 [Senna tora]